MIFGLWSLTLLLLLSMSLLSYRKRIRQIVAPNMEDLPKLRLEQCWSPKPLFKEKSRQFYEFMMPEMHNEISMKTMCFFDLLRTWISALQLLKSKVPTDFHNAKQSMPKMESMSLDCRMVALPVIWKFVIYYLLVCLKNKIAKLKTNENENKMHTFFLETLPPNAFSMCSRSFLSMRGCFAGVS